MNKKISFGAAVAFMLIVAAVTFSMTMIYSRQKFNTTLSGLTEREQQYSKIAEIDEYVRQNFIKTLDPTTLMDALSAGYLTGTGDEYAKYYSATEYARTQRNLNSQSVQIGILPKKNDNGYIEVSEVYPTSPAQAASIESGDLIVKINDTDITNDNYLEAVGLLYGDPGTTMNITVRRGIVENTLELTRRFVEVPTVFTSMIEGSVGLVRFSELGDTAPDQFIRKVDALIDEGANALIFDVRGVSTGTLSGVSQVLDKLLPEGVLVSSTDKDGNTVVLEQSDAREVTLPMAILVNEKTSGEAELFAQTIVDYGKGKMIGAKTAGKGTMQRTYVLTDGSAVRLTTARYKPPISPIFDTVGLRPDYEVKTPEEQAMLSGIPESDPQLKKAMEVVTAAMKASDVDIPAGSVPNEEVSSSGGENIVTPESASDDESQA